MKGTKSYKEYLRQINTRPGKIKSNPPYAHAGKVVEETGNLQMELEKIPNFFGIFLLIRRE